MRSSASETVDVRIMRQSMRCFWLGLAGFTPGFGIGLAAHALRLSRSVARDSGDIRRNDFPLALLGSILAASPLLQIGLGWIAVASLLTFGCVVYGAWVMRSYFVTEAAKWNPARAWAWSGAALGALGLGLSAALLEAFYVEAFQSILLGVK